MSFRYVRIVARFCFSSSTHHVPRYLSSSPFILPRLHASILSRCCSSVCVKLQSESTHTKNTNRPAIESVLDSVVHVFTFSSPPMISQPWLDQGRSTAGTGFVISGKRILTNAHVVKNEDDKSYVQVKKHGSPITYKAIVEAIGHECDLAILVVDNEEFWDGLIPLELGEIPFISDDVSVVGYPIGGETISVTKGIVSRVGHGSYCQNSPKLLTIQVDAAINYGNSGGPVVMGNKVAGVAFEILLDSENISYIIPTPVIKHFLSSVEETGQYIGLCSLDITYQRMEDDQLRKHFKMNHEMTGVLINEINPLSDAHKVLKKDDVILAIDGVPIANDETVPLREKDRINFNHLVSMKKPGEKALFKVLRDGREHDFNISLSPMKQGQDSVSLPNKSYYIFAGFVFVPLITSSYICPCALKRKPRKQEIVIIYQVLLDAINRGYS